MATSTITNIDEAESAWTAALTAATTDDMRVLLHPQFIAVHAAVRYIHNAEEFIAQANVQPRLNRVQMLAPTVQDFGDVATVTCIQQMDAEFVPGLPPFVIEASATRIWVRHNDSWKLAHLQQARRYPPG